MILRMATEKDLELLTELRMAYILDGGRMLPEEEKEKIRASVRSYFERNLLTGSCIAVIAEQDGRAGPPLFSPLPSVRPEARRATPAWVRSTACILTLNTGGRVLPRWS